MFLNNVPSEREGNLVSDWHDSDAAVWEARWQAERAEGLVEWFYPHNDAYLGALCKH